MSWLPGPEFATRFQIMLLTILADRGREQRVQAATMSAKNTQKTICGLRREAS